MAEERKRIGGFDERKVSSALERMAGNEKEWREVEEMLMGLCERAKSDPELARKVSRAQHEAIERAGGLSNLKDAMESIRSFTASMQLKIKQKPGRYGQKTGADSVEKTVRQPFSNVSRDFA